MFQLVPVPLDPICICLVVLLVLVVAVAVTAGNASGQASSQQHTSDPLFLPVKRGDGIDVIHSVQGYPVWRYHLI